MDYEELVKEIKTCPVTWVGALLRIIVERALEIPVFKPGMLVDYVKKVQAAYLEKQDATKG